jgi:ribosomal protein L37AE/L43A
MKKNTTIANMQAEIVALKEAQGKKKEKKDDVCPDCGGDLEYVEEGVVYCSHCDQYYDVEEGEEE